MDFVSICTGLILGLIVGFDIRYQMLYMEDATYIPLKDNGEGETDKMVYWITSIVGLAIGFAICPLIFKVPDDEIKKE